MRPGAFASSIAASHRASTASMAANVGYSFPSPGRFDIGPVAVVRYGDVDTV